MRLAQGAPEDEVVQEEDYKQKALQLSVAAGEGRPRASTGAEYVRERLPDQVPERQRVMCNGAEGRHHCRLRTAVASPPRPPAPLQADEESVRTPKNS